MGGSTKGFLKGVEKNWSYSEMEKKKILKGPYSRGFSKKNKVAGLCGRPIEQAVAFRVCSAIDILLDSGVLSGILFITRGCWVQTIACVVVS
jgi:hypothetical protein